MTAGKTVTKKRSNQLPEGATACFHCGETCPQEPVMSDQHAFCCEGCRTVYDILNNNGLCQYYQIDADAGVSLRGKNKAEYAYLDEAEVRERLIDFSDGKRTRVTFFLPQIHCASCIWLLENLYKLSPGIDVSHVNFLKKEAHITYSEAQISLRQVAELLASIGYAPAITLGSLEPENRPITERQFYYKLGVAGFAFGNIMLLSFPEYLGMELHAEGNFARMFGYLNILLALPVVLYSAQDYFRSAWQGLRQRELNLDVPITLGVLALFARSLYEILSHSGAGYLDSLAGLIFFLLIGKWFQQRTYHHISFERDYKSYFPIAATRLINGSEKSVSLDRLEAGDVIRVRHGELIPADAVILRGEGRLDYSFVTGESVPVQLPAGERVFAGGRQLGDSLELSLTRKVSQSYLTQLWNEEAFAKKQETKASQLANRIGRNFTFLILLVAGGALLYWMPRDLPTAINAFTSVLIIACPCAVALAIPFIFGNVMRILGRHHFFLKNTQVIEALHHINTVIFDKTGTLTTHENHSLTFVGAPLNTKERAQLLATTLPSTHPLSRQITLHLTTEEENAQEVEQWEEHTGQGVRAKVGGHWIRVGSATWLGIQNPAAGGSVYVEIDNQPRGYFTSEQALREGTDAVLQYAQQLGDVYLLSGDTDRQADRFRSFFEASREGMHFQQSPKDKLTFIQALQQKGRRILMIGDGLNDAGALKQSDVGVVLTEDTGNFTPASDGILSARTFHRFPALIQYARNSTYLVLGAYGLAFIYNVFGLSIAVQGHLSPVIAAILMPLSSVTIVLFGTLGSNLLARYYGLHRGKLPAFGE